MADLTDLAGLGKVGVKVAEIGERFLERIFGPASDEIGDILRERIQRRRHRRVITIAAKASEIVGDKPIQQIPDRTLTPWLNGAANEDHEDLQGRWAALLANTALDNKVPPSFPAILSALSPADATILDWIYVRDDLKFAGDRKSVPLVELRYPTPEDYDDSVLRLAIDNLTRLGLIRPTARRRTLTDHHDPDEVVLLRPDAYPPKYVTLTALGEAFVVACYPPGQAEINRRTWNT